MLTIPRTHRRRPDIEPLLHVPALTRASPRQLAELAPHATTLRIAPGRTVVEANRTARELIVIVAGHAEALGPDGSRTTLGPGTEIGGRETLARDRYATTIVATSTLDVVVVNGPALRWAHAEGITRLAPVVPAHRLVASGRSGVRVGVGAGRSMGHGSGSRYGVR